jgi:hypothetical protein
MRRLSIDNRKYVWRVYRRRSRVEIGAQVFMAGLEGCVAAPIRIVFENAEGYPERVGIVVAVADPPLWFNLHLPRTAEAIIRHALATVWQPENARGALEIQDGRGFMRSLPADVRDATIFP